MMRQIFIGYDHRDFRGFAVAAYTIRQSDRHIPIRGLVLDDLIRRGLYWRPTKRTATAAGHWQLWDEISNAPMSTEFAISRFLVPILANRTGWALFVDGDVMARGNISKVFELGDHTKAVMVVQHDHRPADTVKMDEQIQTQYPRKNWSSVMLFNCSHEAHDRLTLDLINSAPGRDLHRFCWLNDDEIGALPQEWNYLVGYTEMNSGRTPAIVHFTEGLPDMPGYENQEYAEEWRALLPKSVGAL